MFVTSQLKNPSQQDRFSEAQQIDAGGPGPLVCQGNGKRSKSQETGGARGGTLREASWPAAGWDITI